MLLPLNVLAEAILAPLPGAFQPKLAVSIHPNFPNASGKPNGVGGIGFLFQYKVATYSLLNCPPPRAKFGILGGGTCVGVVRFEWGVPALLVNGRVKAFSLLGIYAVINCAKMLSPNICCTTFKRAI